MAAWHESRYAGVSRRARRRYIIVRRVLGTIYGLAVLGLAALIVYKVAR